MSGNAPKHQRAASGRHDSGTCSRCIAEKRLIAAAPDLRDAAVAIDMALTALPLKLCTQIANAPGVIEAVRLLRAAIAKAEGQTGGVTPMGSKP